MHIGGKKAFSLVELMLVLTIIGLLIGAVIGGQSFIHNTRLMKLGTEAQSYYTAARAFRDKYSYLPGDMPGASNYWDNVVNGNGDGRMTSNYVESLEAWKQLAKSGFITGQYSGSPNPPIPGSTLPAGAIAGSCYSWNVGLDTSNSFLGVPGNMATGNELLLGAASLLEMCSTSIISASDARSVDLKFDDGRPGLGAIQGTHSSSKCADDTDRNIAYYSTHKGEVCGLLFTPVL